MTLTQSFTLADSGLHDLKGFNCGKPPLDQFLGRFAIKHMKIGVSRTWVLAEDEPPKSRIAAYYTLGSMSVERDQVPVTKTLPPYPIPIVLLARLAVDNSYQGQGLGGKTLVSALRRAVEVADAGLPAIGLILDAKDDQALAFYQHYELFEPFTDDPMRLFAPMNVLRKI